MDITAKKNKSPVFYRKTEGSFTVEAAILVPFVVLILLPFLYLFRMTLFYGMMEQKVQNELSRLAAMSYMLKAAEMQPDDTRKKKYQVEDQDSKEAEYDNAMEWIGSMFSSESFEETEEDLFLDTAGQLYLWMMLQEDLSSEDLSAWGVEGGWGGISFDESRFFYKDSGHGQLMKAVVSIEWQSPVSFWSPDPGRIIRVTHAFMGEKDTASASWKAAEAPLDDEMVYRIGEGEKYHSKDCFLIDKQVYSLSKSEAENKGLLSCSLCGGGNGENQAVYATPGGLCYHGAGCSVIFPDLQELTLEEAEAQGLQPCGLCYGGSGGLFH